MMIEVGSGCMVMFVEHVRITDTELGQIVKSKDFFCLLACPFKTLISVNTFYPSNETVGVNNDKGMQWMSTNFMRAVVEMQLSICWHDYEQLTGHPSQTTP